MSEQNTVSPLGSFLLFVSGKRRKDENSIQKTVEDEVEAVRASGNVDIENVVVTYRK